MKIRKKIQQYRTNYIRSPKYTKNTPHESTKSQANGCETKKVIIHDQNIFYYSTCFTDGGFHAARIVSPLTISVAGHHIEVLTSRNATCAVTRVKIPIGHSLIAGHPCGSPASISEGPLTTDDHVIIAICMCPRADHLIFCRRLNGHQVRGLSNMTD